MPNIVNISLNSYFISSVYVGNKAILVFNHYFYLKPSRNTSTKYTSIKHVKTTIELPKHVKQCNKDNKNCKFQSRYQFIRDPLIVRFEKTCIQQRPIVNIPRNITKNQRNDNPTELRTNSNGITCKQA